MFYTEKDFKPYPTSQWKIDLKFLIVHCNITQTKVLCVSRFVLFLFFWIWFDVFMAVRFNLTEFVSVFLLVNAFYVMFLLVVLPVYLDSVVVRGNVTFPLPFFHHLSTHSLSTCSLPPAVTALMLLIWMATDSHLSCQLFVNPFADSCFRSQALLSDSQLIISITGWTQSAQQGLEK